MIWNEADPVRKVSYTVLWTQYLPVYSSRCPRGWLCSYTSHGPLVLRAHCRAHSALTSWLLTMNHAGAYCGAEIIYISHD